MMNCVPCVAALLLSLHSDGYKRSLSALIERDHGEEFIQQVRAEYKALKKPGQTTGAPSVPAPQPSK